MPHFVINILYYTNDIKLNVLNINIDSWGDGASQVSNLTARVHGTANSHITPKMTLKSVIHVYMSPGVKTRKN